MKTFQEKEKKLYQLLEKLNNFDASQLNQKGQIEIDELKIHKNQLEIEKNNLEEKYHSLVQELEKSQKKIEEFFINIFKNRQEYENKKLRMKTFKSTNSWTNDNEKILAAII